MSPGVLHGLLRRLRRRSLGEPALHAHSAGELDAMRAAGLVVAGTLAAVTEAARAGTSTAALDELAEARIRDAGAVPSFKGYHGFPASLCTSVNEEVVHGIPAADRVLASGDLLSVDCGAIVDGWHGDAAVTIEISEARAADAALSACTWAALLAGIDAARSGGWLSDISSAIQRTAERNGAGQYGLITEYGGHGIGRDMHMEPFVPNAGTAGHGPRLEPGVTLAIEPMLTGGPPETVELDDGWTVVTADGAPAAHWEHTVAVTADGPWVLTAPEPG